MPLALSQVRVDSLLGASCPECEVRVDQGEPPGCELTCYPPGLGGSSMEVSSFLTPHNEKMTVSIILLWDFLFNMTKTLYELIQQQ